MLTNVKNEELNPYAEENRSKSKQQQPRREELRRVADKCEEETQTSTNLVLHESHREIAAKPDDHNNEGDDVVLRERERCKLRSEIDSRLPMDLSRGNDQMLMANDNMRDASPNVARAET